MAGLAAQLPVQPACRRGLPRAHALVMTTFVSWLATAVGCLFLVPQLARLIRLGCTAGVSPSAAAIGVIQTTGWACYGLGTGAWAVVIPSAIAAPQYAAVVWLSTSRRGHQMRSLAHGCLALVAVVVASGLSVLSGAGPWAGLGAGLTLIIVAQYVPAVAAAFGPDGTSGLSVMTWLLIGGNGTIWAGYGAITAAPAVTAYGVVLVLAAASILTAISVGSLRRRQLSRQTVIGYSP